MVVGGTKNFNCYKQTKPVSPDYLKQLSIYTLNPADIWKVEFRGLNPAIWLVDLKKGQSLHSGY